jgi:prepilin peptidase CpaA
MNLAVTLTAAQAWIFLPLALPIALWACYTDITEFKIKNVTVLALLAGFIVLGPFALGWGEYAWRFAHFGVVLAIGFVLSAVMGIGAGDAKFAAAMAPFIALADVGTVLIVWTMVTLTTVVLYAIRKFIPMVANVGIRTRLQDALPLRHRAGPHACHLPCPRHHPGRRLSHEYPSRTARKLRPAAAPQAQRYGPDRRDDARHPAEDRVPQERGARLRNRHRDLPAHAADAGADRHAPRDGADAGHRHAARDLFERDGLPADRRRQGARARCAVAVGILRRDAGAAGGLQGTGEAPVDQERQDHPRPAGGLDGPPDPARGHDRPARAGGDIGPFGPDVRPARQR